MDRTGQLWATSKRPECNNLYVIIASRDIGKGEFEHDIAVFTGGRLVRNDMRVKEAPSKWESYIKLIRIV